MKWSRRDMIKGLGGLPIIGGIWWAGASHKILKTEDQPEIITELNIPPTVTKALPVIGGKPTRIGICGFGGRGVDICKSMGFLKNPTPEDIKTQKDLNVQLVAVCDSFDIRAQNAISWFSTDDIKVKRFNTHQEMIRSGVIDAIIIATPDHSHAPIAIDALSHNIHTYIEKPMTHSIEETYVLKEAAEKSKAHLMVGHQLRQTFSFKTAKDVINKGTLGHISLIQTNSNRNSDNGAWQHNIHEEASEQTINWEQFLGNAPKIPFNKEHFFRWRKWWSYGSGLSGDLLSHDYDRLNCVINMGIPNSVMASGGIYTHIDGRNVPDVLQVNMEYPNFNMGDSLKKGKEKGMTFVYSATLGNGFYRPTLLMGHDATMELGNKLTVWPDKDSTIYADMLETKKMKPSVPIYQFDPGKNVTDAVSSATSQYFKDKGLMWTYINGAKVDPTYLHVREWVSVIKNGGVLSCGIKEGFEETMTSHMTGLSYKLGRRIEWDSKTQKIMPIEGIDFDKVLLDNS